MKEVTEICGISLPRKIKWFRSTLQDLNSVEKSKNSMELIKLAWDKFQEEEKIKNDLK